MNAESRQIIKLKRSLNKMEDVFHKLIVVLSRNVMAAIDLHQTSRFYWGSLKISFEHHILHIWPFEKNVAPTVKKEHFSSIFLEISKNSRIPEGQSIFKEISSSVNSDGIQSWFVL